MNPAPNQQTADASASAAYAEAFVPESDASRRARTASAELGVAPVSRGTAAALSFLAGLTGTRTVVEVGTGAGVSGVALLEGMGNDGVLTSIDAEPQHQAAARAVFSGAGIPNRRARLIAGDALQVLPKMRDSAYDLVFIDGDPLEYVEYIEAALRLLRPGGLLAVHRALAGGKVADTANADDDTVIIREALAAVADSDELSPVLLPVGEGLLLARRA